MNLHREKESDQKMAAVAREGRRREAQVQAGRRVNRKYRRECRPEILTEEKEDGKDLWMEERT